MLHKHNHHHNPFTPLTCVQTDPAETPVRRAKNGHSISQITPFCSLKYQRIQKGESTETRGIKFSVKISKFLPK